MGGKSIKECGMRSAKCVMKNEECGMRNYRIISFCVVLFLLFTIVGFLWPEKSDAIPYFSRKYNSQCAMCHVQFPRLNTTGMTFKQNGYRLKGENGEFIWQDKVFPFSGMAVLKYRMINRKGEGWIPESGNREDGSQNIFLIDEMEFFSAGTLAPRVSYFLSLGSEMEMGFEPGVAFIIFDDILPESKLNIKAGKFYNEFLHLAEKRRLTFEPYMAPVSRIQYGVELNGEVQSRWGIRYAGGVANDELAKEKAGQTGVGYVDELDVSNNIQAFYGWLAYNMPGYTMGVRGYTAKAGEGPYKGVMNDHTQFDININIDFKPVIFTLAYYIQSNVDGVDGDDQNNLLTELVFAAGPQLLVDFRYELQDKDILKDKDSRYVLNTGYYFSPNIAVMGEYSRQDGKESQKDENKLQIGIQLVF